jgi:DNA-binding XRE family transcriptional regulator
MNNYANLEPTKIMADKRNEKLITARESKLWSKSDLARESGLAWRTVDRAELGLSIARKTELQIAKALNMKAEDLFGRTRVM